MTEASFAFDGVNDGRFPDESDVEVRYPARGTATPPRDEWPWMPAVIDRQVAPDEWIVTVYGPGLAQLEDGNPAPEGTVGEDQWYPQSTATHPRSGAPPGDGSAQWSRFGR